LEGIEIRYEINNFVDIAHVMLEMVRHFASAKRVVEIKASRRILEILVRTKMVEQSEIEQVMMLITETSQLVSAQGVVR